MTHRNMEMITIKFHKCFTLKVFEQLSRNVISLLLEAFNVKRLQEILICLELL